MERPSAMISNWLYYSTSYRNYYTDHYRNYYTRIHIQEGLGWKGIKRKIFKIAKENAKIRRQIKAEEKLYQTEVL